MAGPSGEILGYMAPEGCGGMAKEEEGEYRKNRMHSVEAFVALSMVTFLTQLKKPAFSVGIEEGVREVIPIILWDLKWFISDTVIQVL